MPEATLNNIILLVVCLLAGIILRITGRAPEQTHLGINAFIVNLSLPALTLLQIHQVAIERGLIFAVAMPWLFFGVGAIIFGLVGHQFKLPRTSVGALIVTASMGNTSFIGLPMIEAFYGPSGMPVGILIDQLGSYLALSTVGILLICLYAESSVSRKDMALRIATFPPLLALLLALCLLPFSYPDWLVNLLTRIAATVAPLALVSVGLQLRIEAFSKNRNILAAGLFYKLIAGPLLVALLFVGGLGWTGKTADITIFESGMAPMIGASIVAIQYGLDAILITLMVGIGTVLSFLTLPALWYMFH